MKEWRRVLAMLAAAWLIASGSLAVIGSGVASAAKSPIIIGYITDETGVASPNFADGAGGAQARIDLQNAEGGVNGHPLKLVAVDDQSSPTVNTTAAQDLVESKGAFLVIDYSVFTFAAAPYLQKAGVPVVGFAFDGPEWTSPQNRNMFSYQPPVTGPIDGSYYTYADYGNVLHDLGVTKLAGLSYGISPSSQQAVTSDFASAKSVGIGECYVNDSVAYGAADFTSEALQIKSAGCNGVTSGFADASVAGLASSVKHAGINAAQLNSTGYDQDVLDDPAAEGALDGTYFASSINFTTPNSATQHMLSTLKKYDPSYRGGIPDYGLYGSYISADLAVKGLELAGKNPTRSSFITNLRKVSSYNAGGILPSNTTFQHFGTPAMFPQQQCLDYAELEHGTFVIVAKNVCGKLVATT